MLESQSLRALALNCRSLASTRQSREAYEALLRMADFYDQRAQQRDQRGTR